MINQYEYKMNNKRSYGCSICKAFNEAYNSDITNFQYSIPQEAGSGDINRIIGTRGIRVTDYNLNFIEPIEIHGVSRIPHMDMLFCLGDDMNWELPQVGKEFQLLSGESYIGTSYETRKNSIYPAKRDINLIEIKIPLCEIQDIVKNIRESCKLHWRASENMIYGKYKVTPSIQVILQQIIKCPYEDTIKQLYIEGKLLELVAVYLNEIVYEKERIPNKINISCEDLHCIYRAKDILDENIYETPSITCISRCILLNEYKLKKGFKELYGVPIHTYVINKRLENAKFLLEQKNLTVSQVAAKVGYLNMSHFAAAFRKKYGVNPKAYMNDVKK